MARQRNTSTRKQADSDPVIEIADRLHSASIHLLRRLRKVDEVAGIGAAQLSALSVVVFSGPTTLGELAAAEQVRPPTMSRIVDHLEMRGLVSRMRDDGDRRIVRVTATAKGRKLLNEGRSRRVAALVTRLTTLSKDQISCLERGVKVMEDLVRKP